jgi:hypothetical protein
MTSRNFIALADALIKFNNEQEGGKFFTEEQVNALADFCASQNDRFSKDMWLKYYYERNSR